MADATALELIAVLALGFAGGVGSGLVGVGGGVLFVPAFVFFLHKSQVSAEATSLLAIIFVAALGTWRQHGYGNLRPREAVILAVLSPLGVVAGTVLSNDLPEETLKYLFAGVMLYFAFTLGRRALRGAGDDEVDDGDVADRVDERV